MARFQAPLLASLLLVSVALAAALPGSGDAQTSNHIVISEVLYDAPQSGTDTSYEWVELFNPTGAAIDLTGWILQDNNSQDAIPAFTLAAGQYLVIAATASGFMSNHAGFTGNLVSLDGGSGTGSIGNGLANAGDRVILRDSHDTEIDSMSYGSDTSEFNPACQAVAAAGQSLGRQAPWQDTDTANDWAPQTSPNPGQGNATPTPAPSPTSSATATPTPTRTSTSSPSPTSTPSFTPTPAASATPSPTATASASPTPSVTPSWTPTPSSTATATPTPTGTLTPAPTATASPSPSPTPAETPTATSSPTATFTATETTTAAHTSTPTPSPVATPTATPTSTATSAPTALPRLRLNEFLPYPDQIDWNGDGTADFEDEWIEVVNLEAFPIDLTGWMLDDVAGGGSRPYLFETGTLLPPNSFLLRFRSTTKVALNQDTDTVRLVAPDGTEIDSYTYTHPQRDGSYSRTVDGLGTWTDTYPPSPGSPNQPPTPTPSPTPNATPAETASPTPTAVASATPTMTAMATQTYTPTRTSTPSRTPTAPPTATSTPSGAFPGAVVITEIMQNPKAVEDSHGEFIEVFNATNIAIDLNGWTIRDLGGDRHRIDAGGPLWLPAHSYLVLGRDANPATNGGASVTYQYASFSLGNDDDEVVLEDGAGQEIDRVAYGSAGGFPDPNGASMALISPDRDNASGSNWRASFTAWPGSAGDLGSPGAANPIPPAQIEGHVFEDLDSNGHRGQGEPGIAGVTVKLSTGAAVRTDANGWYGFYGLSAGAYMITEVQPAGYTSTTPDELAVAVAPAEISWGHDFGERRQPTPTPTFTPTGQPMAWPRLLLSEVYYDTPQSGTDTAFEFVELWNGDTAPVDLQGWRVRDNTADDLLPAFTLNPGEFVVIAATTAGFSANFPAFRGPLVSLEGSLGGGLGNGGDRVILLAPDGTAVDAMSYGADSTVFAAPCPDVPAGASLARVPTARDTDSAADWAMQVSPSPGQPGASPAPTPTATANPLPTASPTRTATYTTSPSPTALQTRTPTPTWTPTATSGLRPNVRLNEVLPRPAQIDWDGDGQANQYDEWVEIINFGRDATELGGWVLDDISDGGSQPYVIPAGTLLPPGDFLVLFRRQTGIALNNDGDSARLIAPDGTEVDSLSYTKAEPDSSYSRMIDGTGDWTEAYPPSPGCPNLPAAPTATSTPSSSATWTATATASPTPTPSATITPFPSAIYLNEILPEPDATDWNSDGVVDSQDEFVELFNAGAFPVNLGGWAVADDTHAYTLPLGTMIWPRGYLTLFRSQTHRSLGNDQEAVSLWRPDGSLADGFTYTVGPGPDRSYCRDVDGIGVWVLGCQPTPGEANRFAPPPVPPPANDEEDDANSDSGWATSWAAAVPATIAAARAAPAGTWVTIVGSVTLPPGVFGRRIYLEDDSGGIGVYLRRGEYPPLALGDRVSVTGRVGSNYGEAEIEVSSQNRIVALGDSVMPTPRRLRTGEVGEAYEGRLAWVFGRAVAASRTTVTLDDGTGLAALYFPEGLPWRRPYVKLGDFWAAQGVIGQYAAREPYIGGYRLIPRLAADFSQAPLFLPVTGAGLP